MTDDRGSIQARVAAVVAEALDAPLDRVTEDASLIDDLGAESIDFLDILFRLESEFGIKISETELWKGSVPQRITVRTIVGYLEHRETGGPARPAAR